MGRGGSLTTALLALAGLFWLISFGAIRDFVWADLRAGLVNPRGLSRATRCLIWLGFGLLFAMLGVVLNYDHWRTLSPLVAMTTGPAGRGALLPIAVVPLTLFLLAVAWSFALAGALHSHWLIRLSVLALF